jgi:subtilisin family serine protease
LYQKTSPQRLFNIPGRLLIMMINRQNAVFAAKKPQAASPAAPAQETAQAQAASAAPSDNVQISASQGGFNLSAMMAETAKEAASLEGKLPEHVENEVIVKLKPEFAFAQTEGATPASGFAEQYGAKVLQKFDIPENMFKSFNGEMVRVKLPAGMSTAQAMVMMAKDDRVEYAVQNDVIKLNTDMSGGAELAGTEKPENLNGQLWGINNEGQTGGKVDADVDAPEAWALQTGKTQSEGGPLIAVIDTGINYNHEALAGNIWTNPGEIPGDGIDNDNNGVVDDVHGFNAAADTGDPLDDQDHGSHCAGSIGANGTNSKGLYGVAQKANLMGVKFLTASGGGTLADAIESVLYATKMGARVTSNSWGGGGFNQALYDAFKSSPAMHIIAAGNESNNNDARPAYPATFDLPNVISVAATDHKDGIARFSNYGATTVDLGAPGVDILSSTSGGSNEYKSFSGTSMATPHVTGAASVLLSEFPEMSNEELKSRLMNTGDSIASLQGKTVSGKRLNVNNAMETDTTAPGAPNDFGIKSATAGQVVVGFTATGDDGWCGDAASYIVKVSDVPIVDGEAAEGQVSFADAQSVVTAAPGETGTLEEVAIKTRLSGTERPIYVALKVADNIGNLSEVRTASGTVPAAKVAFEDTVDGQSNNFTAEGSWAKVDEAGRGKVWTDSPDGAYGQDSDISLTSRAISLKDITGATLAFDAKTDLENRYDNVFVEVAEVPAEGAEAQWQGAATLNGGSDWSTREVDLSAYDGKDVQVRFRLKSDGSVNQDGIYLDNIVIAGGEG